MRLGDHCGRWLSEAANVDQRIWCLDGDLADSDGACHFAKQHPRRFIMAGIAEQSMVSIAAGMASSGLRPWVFSFASFLAYRAYDQIRMGLSQARQPVTLVASHSGGLSSRNGKSHAALNDIAMMVTLPHLQIWSPCDPADLFFAGEQIMKSSEPAYLRLPRRPLESLKGEPGLIRRIRPAQSTTIVSTGLGTHLAMETYKNLKAKAFCCGLIHLLRLAPFPSEALLHELDDVDRLVVIEDHVKHGGLYSLIQNLNLDSEIMSFGWPLGWSGQSGSDEDILKLHGMDAAQITTSIVNAIRSQS